MVAVWYNFKDACRAHLLNQCGVYVHLWAYSTILFARKPQLLAADRLPLTQLTPVCLDKALIVLCVLVLLHGKYL